MFLKQSSLFSDQHNNLIFEIMAKKNMAKRYMAKKLISAIKGAIFLLYLSNLRGRGGGGVHPFFVVVELDFEIKQLTNKLRPMTKLLMGFRTPVARGTATPLFGQFCQITLTCSKQCFGVLYA